MNYDNEEIPTKKIILVSLTIILLLIFIFGSFYTIPAGARGVILTFGKPSDLASTEGLHFKIPIAQRVIKMDVKTQKYEAPASSASRDLQVVSTNVAVNYHIVPDTVPILYQEIGITYQDRVIQPAVQEVVKSATAKFTAEELITKRPEVKDEIERQLKERMQKRGIILEELSITNFDFSESFNSAIEAKVTAEQNALAAKNKLEQVKYEAEQKIEEAKGKAEAITIESQALKSNPDILELRAIEKWDGKLPTVTGGAVPFVDVNTFAQTA